MSEPETKFSKGKSLLSFLRDFAKLRRLRIPSYRPNDDILWFTNLPRERSECLSPFLEVAQGESLEASPFWLEVRKKRMPIRPDPPSIVNDWVRVEALDDPRHEPELSPQITILVERTVTDPDVSPEALGLVTEQVPEVQSLKDHSEVEEPWLEYLLNSWIPWAEEMQRWLAVHNVYEKVDFMRRRLEEAEERYELLVAVGLLHWRDSTGASIQRHLLTGAAEFEFDAARGVLTVVPAAAFECFKIELDMLELADQPRLDGSAMHERLEALDICAWDTEKVGEILREIGNRARGNAQVNENEFEKPSHAPDQVFHISFAPALVLRERRSTAFDDLINHLLENVEQDPSNTRSTPWDHFLAEGVTGAVASDAADAMIFPVDEGSGRLYFPLPTNEEQRQIIHKLNASSSVVVKGPPGTGKSHTIANLMCHLLASGERILVTAHAPKALTVLRDMLPEEMRDLCVTSLGSTRDDQTLLENGVRGILRRQSDWRGTDWTQAKLNDLEEQLRELERELAKTDQHLRESREAETYDHQLPGGYEGTAASIAKRVEEENETYCWFPDVLHDQPSFPFDAIEVQRISQTHRELTANVREELSQKIGSFSLPNPDEFQTVLNSLTKAEEAISTHLVSDSSDSANLQFSSEVDLSQTLASLQTLEDRNAHSSFVMGEYLTSELLKSVLADHQEQWRRLHTRLQKLLDDTDILLSNLNDSHVRLPEEDIDKLLFDAERRLEHFEGGGRRGLWPFIPRVIRETSYLEKNCSVNGHVAREPSDLRTLTDFIRLSSLLTEFRRTWPRPFNFVSGREVEAAQIVGDLVTEFGSVLGVFRDCGKAPLPCVPSAQRANLCESGERKRWSDAISAELARRDAQFYRANLEEYKETIRSVLSQGHSHPCLQRLSEAVTQRDLAKWTDAWNERERVRGKLDEFNQYNDLLNRLMEYSPQLVAAIPNGEGNLDWVGRFRNLQPAWYWSSGRGWLEEVGDRDRYDALISKSHRLRGKIETKTAELASGRAWLFFFERLNDETRQDLEAWTKANAKLGAGYSKYIVRRRRTAREFLMRCVPKIPSWIMPLHKLWDSVAAEAGLFDTVIIDEASQSGLEALVLLMLAKRIIIVGDDKQNSPEAVGIHEDDIERLTRKHLEAFRFRALFRPDTSLFDHAVRGFPSTVSLREHFRCVPEIIRFSNELCYTASPLIPLRQAPPHRLAPLQAVHVVGASCEGEGQRIRNRIEAEALVEQVLNCIEDESYEGKTMGVVVLQGHSQAELIERILAAKLEPKVIQERKLRCGIPPTFQGDQRDVMFLSLVTAPNVRRNPLTGEMYVRRFNVAMSRAKDQVWLFHSVQQSDLYPQDLRRRLLAFVANPVREITLKLEEERDRLEREARRKPRIRGEQPEPYESWFEVDVALELLRRNYLIRPQYEVAGKWIDLVVEGMESRLAVECDGDIWHGPEQYEHDAMRQRQLERAQWTFIRVRESDFYANRFRAIELVIEACEELGIHPVDYIEEETLSEESDSPTHPKDSEAETLSTNVPTTRATDSPELISTLQEATVGYVAEANFPDPRDAPPANLRKALLKIIETEGPLTKAFVYRLYVEGCPHVQRVSKSVRQTLNRILWSMVKSGEVISEDEIGDRSLESQVLRLPDSPRVLQRPAGKRDLLDIPASELCMHIERLNLRFDKPGLDDELAMRRILEFYGFTRLTSVRRKYLSKVIELHRSKKDPSSSGAGSLWEKI